MEDIALASWTGFKALFAQKNGTNIQFIQYVEHPKYYQIFFFEAGFRYIVSIFKESSLDQIDFETNYKSSANAAVANHVVVDSGNLSVQAASSSGITVNGTVSVLQSGSWTVSLASESIEIGTVDQGTPTGLSNAWPVKITDGVSTSGITNTSPVGTEQGLVVRNIPSGTQQISGTVSVSQPLTVLSSSASGLTINGAVSVSNFPSSITVNNFPSVQSVQAASSGGLTVNLTGTPTVSIAQPITVLASSASGLTINGSVSVSNFPSSITVNNFPSVQSVQAASASGITINGSVGRTWTLNSSTDGVTVSGTVTANAGTGNFTVVQSTGTNLHTVVDSGNLSVQAASSSGITVNGTVSTGSILTTYGASIVSLGAAASATDIFTITGSATKTVKVIRFGLTAVSTADTIYDALIVKRSTANSGGTSTTPTTVKYDSSDAAATAVVRAYTVNPTLGTTVGTITSKKLNSAATTKPIFEPLGDDLFIQSNQAKAIVLRGTSEVLAINLNATTLAGNSINIFVEWTEE